MLSNIAVAAHTVLYTQDLKCEVHKDVALAVFQPLSSPASRILHSAYLPNIQLQGRALLPWSLLNIPRP